MTREVRPPPPAARPPRPAPAPPAGPCCPCAHGELDECRHPVDCRCCGACAAPWARHPRECACCGMEAWTTPWADAAGSPREVCARCVSTVRLAGWRRAERPSAACSDCGRVRALDDLHSVPFPGAPTAEAAAAPPRRLCAHCFGLARAHHARGHSATQARAPHNGAGGPVP